MNKVLLNNAFIRGECERNGVTPAILDTYICETYAQQNEDLIVEALLAPVLRRAVPGCRLGVKTRQSGSCSSFRSVSISRSCSCPAGDRRWHRGAWLAAERRPAGTLAMIREQQAAFRQAVALCEMQGLGETLNISDDKLRALILELYKSLYTQKALPLIYSAMHNDEETDQLRLLKKIA